MDANITGSRPTASTRGADLTGSGATPHYMVSTTTATDQLCNAAGHNDA